MADMDDITKNDEQQSATEYGGARLNPNASPADAEIDKKLNDARQTLDDIVKAPEGYVEVRLSTRGKVGAPAKFWIRNFMPEDLMKLSVTNDNDMPIKVTEVLDNMIWNDPNCPKEQRITVKKFHEKEVIELLLFVYETFYTSVFPEQTWIMTEEDNEYLKNMYGGKDSDAYRDRIRALENGEWKPTFDLDISKLQFHEVPDDFKTSVRVKRKIAGKDVSVLFSLPKFGDFITLKFFIDEIYAKEDRRWASVAEIVKFREDAKERLRKGENVNFRSIPNITPKDEEDFEKYQEEKAVFTMTATKALYMQEFNGQSLVDMPLEERVQYARDPRVDYSLFQQAQKLFDKLEFGYKEEITVFDPIMQKVVNRNYTFQLADLLQAISNPGDIEADISFE